MRSIALTAPASVVTYATRPLAAISIVVGKLRRRKWTDASGRNVPSALKSKKRTRSFGPSLATTSVRDGSLGSRNAATPPENAVFGS